MKVMDVDMGKQCCRESVEKEKNFGVYVLKPLSIYAIIQALALLNSFNGEKPEGVELRKYYLV